MTIYNIIMTIHDEKNTMTRQWNRKTIGYVEVLFSTNVYGALEYNRNETMMKWNYENLGF